jgi:hypothetical protein
MNFHTKQDKEKHDILPTKSLVIVL